MPSNSPFNYYERYILASLKHPERQTDAELHVNIACANELLKRIKGEYDEVKGEERQADGEGEGEKREGGNGKGEVKEAKDGEKCEFCCLGGSLGLGNVKLMVLDLGEGDTEDEKNG